MKPLETQEEIVKYFGSPLEEPELHTELYYKPKISQTDILIKEILANKHSDESRMLSPFTLLDSTVVIPPVIDKFKIAYYQTTTEYGNYVDIYIHEKPIIKAKNLKSRNVRGGRYKENEEKPDRGNEYRRRNSIKALNMIKQLTLQNFTKENVKLLTLTFGDCAFDINNPRICDPLFSIFMCKLRKLFPDLKYLGVLEFQKRGAVHYHVLCDLPYIKKEEIAELWGYGFIDIRKPDYVIGTYLYKYLSKDLNDEKLKGVRVYFHSKNLEKPVNKTGVPAFDVISRFQNSEIHFTNQYTNKYNGGTVKYLQFKVSPTQT
ncbi:hypothetical protein HYV31_02075 [candidate division WWE3 bacterium]|nr:hypothetical protein [candidate division WWE3 bacterium]